MKLHCRRTGPARSSITSTPPMVFVHGAGASSRLFASQYQAFRDSTTAYFLDLPGHGESLHPVEPPSIDLYAQEVIEFINYLSAPAVLVGHSMGGAVALSVALREPDLLQRLVLAGTGCRLPVSDRILDGFDKNYDATLDTILRYCFSKSVDPDLLARGRDEFRKTDPEIVRADFRSCNAFDVCGRLAEITLPTLIVCGDKDMMTPLSFSQQLRSAIPNSRLETIPRGSHMLMIEAAAEFNRVISEAHES
jgi:pimeloyl-ACP methyl ester carboxylesterase